MTKVRKVLSIVLAVLMFTMLAVPVQAEESFVSREDSSEISETVTALLEDNAYNMYMGGVNDIEESVLTDAKKLDLLMSEAAQKKSRSVSAISKFSVDPNVTEFLEDKAEYIQHIQTSEGFERENFEIAYNFEDITVEGNLAVVTVRQIISFQYSDADQPSQFMPIYTVSLARVDNEWVITDIASDEIIDKAYEETGEFDVETAIEEYDEMMSLSEEITDVPVETEVPPATLRVETTTIPYNRANAAAYAMTYTTSETSKPEGTFYNPNFPSYRNSGGDCQNFVSQAIWAGFNGSNDSASISGLNRPMDKTGTQKWYGNFSSNYSSWTSNTAFRTYVQNSKNEASTVDKINYEPPSVRTLSNVGGVPNLLGASLQYSNLNHTVIVVGVEGTSASQIFVCGHTSDVKYKRLSEAGMTSSFYVNVPVSNVIYDAGSATLRVTNKLHAPVAQNSTVTLSATASRQCTTIAMGITPPSGSIQWIQQNDVTTFSSNYKFTQKGLYTIYTDARNIPAGTGSTKIRNTYTIRVY